MMRQLLLASLPTRPDQRGRFLATANDEVLARVTALLVDQSCRGQGMASRLLAKAEETARLHGALRMEITSSNYRQDAHAFYRKHGYAVPDVTRFIKTL